MPEPKPEPKMTRQGVRDLNSFGPRRPAYSRDLVVRREQQLCTHKFEHCRVDGEQYDECTLCRVSTVCTMMCVH